MHLMKDAWNA